MRQRRDRRRLGGRWRTMRRTAWPLANISTVKRQQPPVGRNRRQLIRFIGAAVSILCWVPYREFGEYAKQGGSRLELNSNVGRGPTNENTNVASVLGKQTLASGSAPLPPPPPIGPGAGAPQPPIVLVHLGKTAGSTLTCMLGLGGSGLGDSRCAESDARPSSRLAGAVAERVHLRPAPAWAHERFLATLRNPVDRIVSWYYYQHPGFPPEKFSRHIEACGRYDEFFGCYASIQSLSRDGLSETEAGGNSSCRELAQNMVTGREFCWHNAYNYNYTYGPLLRRSRRERGQQGTAAVAGSRASAPGNLTVYVIRSEHLEHDWAAIEAMLGGSRDPKAVATGPAAPEAPRKNAWGGDSIPNRTLSASSRTNLCRVLCREIQLYKELLALATNLDERDVGQSLKELVATCPREPREVRECPSG